MNRRSLLGQASRALAILGLSGPALLSRVAQPSMGVLQYAVSEGQRLFTLVTLGGGQAGPIVKVLYATARQPDFYQELDPALYRVVGNGWGLEVLSSWDGFVRLMVLHQ